MLYKIFRQIFAFVLKVVGHYRIIGSEHFPVSGPVIVASNHVSNWDPLMVGVAMPRQVSFIAKEELFRISLVGLLLKAWGVVPIKRGRGDREALTKSLELLKMGKVIGIFIEGKRNRGNPETMLNPQPGAAMLALKSGVPVVPVALVNTNRIMRTFKRVKVVIGKPITFTGKSGLEALEKKEQYARISREITLTIQKLYKEQRA